MVLSNQNLTVEVGSITIDAMGLIVTFDAVSECIFEYSSSEVVGHNVRLLMPFPYAQEHDQYLQNYLEGQSPRVIGRGREVVGKRKSKETFPMWLAVSQVTFEDKTFFVGSVIDLSSQQQVREELADSIETTRAILATAVNPIITIDDQGHIETFNKAAESLFLYRFEEVLGNNVSMLMPEPYRSEHDQYLKRYLSEGAPKVIGTGREVEGRRSDGSTFPMHLSVGRMQFKGETRFVGIITDLTDLRKAEVGAKAKAEFLANTSHEIRTPMNAIIGYAEELMRDASLSVSAKEYTHIILRASNDLLVLLNEVLDVAKLESGQVSLEEKFFCLPEIIQQVIKIFHLNIQNKGLRIDVDYAPTLSQYVLGDPYKVRQVLMNLISNALKFTDKGFIHVHVKPASKTFEPHFVIRDTGIGIPPERQKAIFEPFEQVDGSTSRKYGGTGLGLTLCKQLINRMGGSLWVDSVIGEGTAFHFTLPLIEASAQDYNAEDVPFAFDSHLTIPKSSGTTVFDIEAFDASLSHGNTSDTAVFDTTASDTTASNRSLVKEFNVLLAEDIDVNANLINIHLTRCDYHMTHVKNGFEAVEAFKSTHFDLILMDIMMPEMDGIEATKCIRAIESKRKEHCPIPIVALTADVMLVDQCRYQEAGMSGFIAKPINFVQLKDLMQSLIMEKALKPSKYSEEVVKWQKNTEEALATYINLKQVKSTWKDEAAYLENLHSFLLDKLSAVEAMINDRQDSSCTTSNYRAFIHGLKGAAANLGMLEVGKSIETLQYQLDMNRFDVFERQLLDLKLRMQLLQQRCASLLDTRASLMNNSGSSCDQPKSLESSSLPLITDKPVEYYLDQLLLAFDTYDLDIILPILVLIEKNQLVDQEIFLSIKHLTNQCQFKQAREVVKRLKFNVQSVGRQAS